MRDAFIYNPRLEKFKKPFGALRCGEKFCLSAYALSGEIKKSTIVFFSEYTGKVKRIVLDWVARDGVYDILYAEPDSFSSPDIIWYHFELETLDGTALFFGKDGIVYTKEGLRSFQLTVYAKDYETPQWFSEGVTYHIFVDRFFRAKKSEPLDADVFFRVHKNKEECPEFLPNSDGVVENRDIYGGNLEGIIEKLSYLEELGVRTIYLSPIFEAWSNHKYNTADYMKVDSHFGDGNTLKKLCDAAKEKNIKIILDGVFSHTGSDSLYFNREGRYGENVGAYRDKSSPYREWYDIDENNNFASWWGIDTLPQVNELNASYSDFITGEKNSVITHWMKLGVSGWRLDVADELPDEFISKLKRRARVENREALVIGEVWEDASTKKAYGVNKTYFTLGVLDGVMNYPVKNAILDFLTHRISAKRFADVLLEILENYPGPALRGLMNIIGTHDTVRVINELSVGSFCDKTKTFRSEYVLSDAERNVGKKRICQAVVLQYMFPGSPCIYYGDEIGMEGFEDPLNRRFFTWDDMDVDLLSFYRKMGKIKLSEFCLHIENNLKVEYASRGVVVLSRGDVCAMINRGNTCKIFDLKREFEILIGTENTRKIKNKLFFKSGSFCILKHK